METFVGNIEESLRKATGWSIVVAIGLIICGIVVIASPMAGALAAAMLFGATAVVAGALELSYAWRTRKLTGAFWRFLLAAAYIAVGIWVLVNPTMGMVALALALGVTLIARGVMELIAGYQLRNTHGWGWYIADGLVSGLVGVLMLAAWPAGTVLFLGIYFGVSLLMNGVYRLVVSSTLRRGLPPPQAQKPLTAAHA